MNQPSKDYPHRCPRCGSAAYFGLARVDCTYPLCRHFDGKLIVRVEMPEKVLKEADHEAPDGHVNVKPQEASSCGIQFIRHPPEDCDWSQEMVVALLRVTEKTLKETYERLQETEQQLDIVKRERDRFEKTLDEANRLVQNYGIGSGGLVSV